MAELRLVRCNDLSSWHVRVCRIDLHRIYRLFRGGVPILPPDTQSMRIASVLFDIGLLFSVLGIATTGVALWQRRAHVGVCVVVGLFLLALSGLALYATRYI